MKYRNAHLFAVSTAFLSLSVAVPHDVIATPFRAFHVKQSNVEEDSSPAQGLGQREKPITTTYEEGTISQQEIQKLVTSYKESIENREIQKLNMLFKEKDGAKLWSKFFETAKEIKVEVKIEKIEQNNSLPEVEVLFGITYLDNKSREQKVKERYWWALEKINNTWVIAEILPRK